MSPAGKVEYTVTHPRFFDLVLGFMDSDFESGGTYTNTKNFILGKDVILTKEMKKFFHPGVFDKM